VANRSGGLAEADFTRVVCVDLDGTLIAGDLLWEAFMRLVKRKPITAFVVLLSIFRGRAQFKSQVAAHMAVNPAALPYRRELIDALEDQAHRGSRLVLATASHHTYAQAVADHLGIFHDVIASDAHVNLSGRRKAAALVERFGDHGFHYIGNDWSDVPVWRAAGEATLVGGSPRLGRYAAREHIVDHTMAGQRPWLPRLVRALRPHQWVKNLLVFVPMVAAHTIRQPAQWKAAALTFVAFSLCASAIDADRLHPRKRTRPFAAGELAIPSGAAASASLMLLSLAVATAGVSGRLALVVLAYILATSAYSFYIKRQPVLDVFALTGLYMVRVVAGGVATGTPLSSWLLAFILFLFLSLAFVKRYTEVVSTKNWIPGRGYCPDDALWMHAIGTTAGYMAVVVLALYVNAPEVVPLYTRPQVLWLLCPLLLLWVTRLWFRAGRRMIHDDPIFETLKDSATYLLLAAASVITLVAV
jgi:4-hydroxybenzoate polyprenyltransferase